MSKLNLTCLMLVVLVFILLWSGGCGMIGQELDLPENIIEVIPSGFSFESEQTKDIREHSAQAEEIIKDKLESQQWIFSYPGSVEEALAELDIPANAMVIGPYEVSITDIVNPSLLDYGKEDLKGSMGSEWLEEASIKTREWQGQQQIFAEVIFYHESDSESPGSGTFEQYPEQGYWSITLVYPTIDLEHLELLEETSVSIMRLNYKF